MNVNYLSEKQNEKLNNVIKECNNNTKKAPKLYFLDLMATHLHNDELFNKFQGEIWKELN